MTHQADEIRRMADKHADESAVAFTRGDDEAHAFHRDTATMLRDYAEGVEDLNHVKDIARNLAEATHRMVCVTPDWEPKQIEAKLYGRETLARYQGIRSTAALSARESP